ncbi:hypothetical protein E1267_03765 [Nonomuraea longispora]|uniref:M23ase beta-sheet core domain-containing protein n=1 Tax=Nonomuraea longispora TaxID=1848320 RepID=A0A4R4NRT8_9ACTN|nr:hypothetical protein E1267_03765 [Nonomuraea longispora]
MQAGIPITREIPGRGDRVTGRSAGRCPSGCLLSGQIPRGPRCLPLGSVHPSRAEGHARTVHLGVDLFVPAGEPVFAPLDGTVHGVAYRPDPYGYGGVVLLEHDTDDGEPFWLLIGHLGQEIESSLTPCACANYPTPTVAPQGQYGDDGPRYATDVGGAACSSEWIWSKTGPPSVLRLKRQRASWSWPARMGCCCPGTALTTTC